MKNVKINQTFWIMLFLASATTTVRSIMLPDDHFGTEGIVETKDNRMKGLAIQEDGKIVALSLNERHQIFILNRYNENGAYLSGRNALLFCSDSVDTMPIATSENQTIIAGLTDTHLPTFKRYDQDGNLDGSFNPQIPFKGEITSMVIQPDKKIIVAGGRKTTTGLMGWSTFHFGNLIRYKVDGTLDETFNQTSGFNGSFEKMILLPDNKFIVAGFDADHKLCITRYNNDGSPDHQFSPVPLTRVETLESLAIQPNNTLLVAINHRHDSHTQKQALLSYTLEDGTLDTRFGVNGILNQNNNLYSMTNTSNGTIVTLERKYHDDSLRYILTSYNPDGSPMTNADGTNHIALPDSVIFANEVVYNPTTESCIVTASAERPGRILKAILLSYKNFSPEEIERRRIAELAEARLTKDHALKRQQDFKSAVQQRAELHRTLLKDTCAICLDEEIPTNTQLTACGHAFHKDCIDGWLNHSCPVCRAPIETEEEVKKRLAEEEAEIDDILTEAKERLAELDALNLALEAKRLVELETAQALAETEPRQQGAAAQTPAEKLAAAMTVRATQQTAAVSPETTQPTPEQKRDLMKKAAEQRENAAAAAAAADSEEDDVVQAPAEQRSTSRTFEMDV